MNNKMNNMLTEFFNNCDAKNEEELNKALQEFMEKYNLGEIEYENTPLDDAYELLEKATKAKSEKQAIKLAQQAYELTKECFDAILLQASLEENAIKRNKLLDDGLAYEKERLKKEKYFDKENIGHFYGIFETRPYIRGLYIKTQNLLFEGKIKQAKDVCKEILRLNENDNTGARYVLMAIYAYLEEEEACLKLYKKYPEEHLEMLFPLFALYYKLGKDEKAKEYLNRINKANPDFLKFIKGTAKGNLKVPEGCYHPGDITEVLMYMEEYDFLVNTLGTIDAFILEYSKKTTR